MADTTTTETNKNAIYITKETLKYFWRKGVLPLKKKMITGLTFDKNTNKLSLSTAADAKDNVILPSTPIATVNVAGKVKPDGTSITITADGIITAASNDEEANSGLMDAIIDGSYIDIQDTASHNTATEDSILDQIINSTYEETTETTS